MKETVITIIIFLFTAMLPTYAQLYRSQTTTEKENYSGGFFSRYPDNPERDPAGSGIFRSSDPPGLNDRPTGGEGIGEENDVPLKGGLIVLITCSIIFSAMKFLIGKHKKREKGMAFTLAL